jgi:hypothetical protein
LPGKDLIIGLNSSASQDAGVIIAVNGLQDARSALMMAVKLVMIGMIRSNICHLIPVFYFFIQKKK